MQATEAPPEIIESPPIVEEFHAGFASPSTKLLLLTAGGGCWFTGFFLMPAAFLSGLGLAIVGLITLGTAGYSLRKSGHSLVSAIRQFGGDWAEIIEDCSGGAARAARDHIFAPVKLTAIELAKKTGSLTEAELGAIENGAAPDLIRNLDHVFELLAGPNCDGTNCAILAGSKAGKTTFFHGLFHHLANRSGRRILMIGDYNLGKDNGGGVPQWLGLPIYDRRKHGSPISNLVIPPDEILTAVKHLDALYEERIRINADRAKAKRSAIKFDPVYFACDEFQSFMEHCSDADGKFVGEVAGKLLRARGLQIYFFPVMHNDKAEGYLNTTVLGSINLLIMGSLTAKLDSAPELQNSQKLRRFEPETIGRIPTIRRELERDHGKDGAVRSLAVLSLKHPIKCSDGTEFADGNHLLKIPNCTMILNQRWDWPEELKAVQAEDSPEVYFAARRSAPVEVLPVPVAVEDFSDLEAELRDLFVDRYQEFAAKTKGGKISRTAFFELCKAHGFGRNRNSRDRHYRLICTIADSFADKQIAISTMLEVMDG